MKETFYAILTGIWCLPQILKALRRKKDIFRNCSNLKVTFVAALYPDSELEWEHFRQQSLETQDLIIQAYDEYRLRKSTGEIE